MLSTKEQISVEELAQLVVAGMKEKKGVDILLMDMRKVRNAVADFFVICSGNSDTQVDAIANSIEEEVYKHSLVVPNHREGKTHKEWILLDYFNVVAHVFKKDRRAFYNLEGLWGDAVTTHIPSED